MWKWLQCRFLLRKDARDNSNEDEHTNNNLHPGNLLEVGAEVEPDVNLVQEDEPSRITQLLKDPHKSDSFDRSPEQHSKISVKGRSSPTEGVEQRIVEKYVAQDNGEVCLTFEAPCAESSEAVQHQMNSSDDTYRFEALSCVHQEETDPVLSSGVRSQTKNDGETQVVCNDCLCGSCKSSELSSERHSEIECVRDNTSYRDDLREIIQEPHSKGKSIVDFFKETDHHGAFSTSGSFKCLRPSSSSGSLKSPRPSSTSGSLKSRTESVESTKEFEISTFVQHEGNICEDRNEGLEEEQIKSQSVTDKTFIECRNDAKVVRTFDEKYHADVAVSKLEIKNITCEVESRNGCRLGANDSALDFKTLEMPSKENVCNMSDKCFEKFNDNGSLSLLQNGQDITDIGSTVIHEVVSNISDSREVIEDNEEFCKKGNAHTSELHRMSSSFPKELDTQQYSFVLPSKVVSLVTSLYTESRELSVEAGGKKEVMCGYNELHASSFVSTSDDSALEGSGLQQDIKDETGEKENNGILDANEVKLDPLYDANDILGAKQLPSSMFHGDTDPDYCHSKAQDQSVLEVNEERSQSEVSAGAQTTMITPESITCLHPYPCCSYLTCLYNQSGQICTILGQQFILTSVQESPVLVQVGLVNHLHLKYGCVFLWQDGTPQLLETIPDGTSVLFDAIALPNFKAFTALVIWQVAKPVLTTEAYLSNKYVFIKELKDLLVHTVSIKQNFGTFSVDIDGGTKILKFDFDDLFINGEVATAEARAADILESGNPFFANIVKFFKRSATGAISHEFKCSLVWTGVKPTIETHEYKCSTYYTKEKESYSISESQSWLLCDTESLAVISNGKYVVRYDVQGKEQSTPFKPEFLYCGSKQTKVTDGIRKTKAHIRRHVAKSGKEVHQVMMVQILETSLDNAKDSASKGEQKICQDESLGADPVLCCERSETQENGCGESSLVASVTDDLPPPDSGLDYLENRLNDKENLVVTERKDDHIDQVNDAQSKSVELFQNDNRDYQWEFWGRANEVQLFDNQEDHVNRTEAKDSEVFMSDEECCSRESEDDFKGLQIDHEKYTKELKSKDSPVPHFVESWTNFPDSVFHLNQPHFSDFLPTFIKKEFDDKGLGQEAVIRGIGESSALYVKEIAKSSDSLDVTEVKCCVTGKDSLQLIGATSQSFEKNNSPNMAERMFENHMLSSELSAVTQQPLLLQSWPGLLYFEKDNFILYTKVNGLGSDIMVSTVACVVRDGKLIKLEKDSPSQLVLFDAFYDHERCRYYVTVIWEGNLPQIVHALNAVYFYNVEGVYDRFVKKSKTSLVSLYGIKEPLKISGVNGVVSPEGKPVDWPPSPGTQLILQLRKLSTALCKFEWYANLIIVLSVESDRTVQFSRLDSNAKSLNQILSDKDSQLITSSSPQKCMADLDISQTSLRGNDVPCRTQKYYNFSGKLRRYLKDYVGTIMLSDTGEQMIVSSIDGLEFWVRPCEVIFDNGKVFEISKANVGLVVKYDAFCDDVKLPHKAELIWIGEKPGEIILEPNTKVLYDIRGIFTGTETTENTTDYSLILNLNGQQRLVKCPKSVRVILPDGNLFLEKLSHGDELCVYLEEKNNPISGTVQYIIRFLFILGKAEANHPLLLKDNFKNFEQTPIYAQNLVASPGGFSATEKEETVERKSLNSEEDFKASSCDTELYGEKVSERQSFSCKSKLIIDQQKSFEAVLLQDGDPDSGFLRSDSQCLFEGTKSQHRIKSQDPLSLPQDVNNEDISCMDEYDIGRSVIADDLTNMMLIDMSDRSSAELNILPGEDPNDSEGDVIRGEALQQLLSNCPKSVSQFFPVYVGCIQKEHLNYSDFCFNHNGVSHVLHLPANLYHIVCGSDEVFKSPTYVFIRKEEEKNTLGTTPVYHPILSWQGRRREPLHVIRNQKIIVYNAADKLITLKSDQDKTMQSYILATERIVSRKGDFIVKENFSSIVNKDMLTYHAVVENVPEAFISGHFVCEKILFMSSSLYVLTAFLRSFTTNCVDNIQDTNPPSSISSNDTSIPLSVMEMDTSPPLSVASKSASVPQIAADGIESVACSEILNAYRANKIDAARCKDGRTYHVFDVLYTEDPVNCSIGSLKRCNEMYGVIYSRIRNAFVLCDIANVFFQGKKVTSFNDIDKKFKLHVNHIRVPLISGIEVDGVYVDSLALMAWVGCESGVFTIHECKSHETVLFTFEENRMIDSEFNFFAGVKAYDVLLGVPPAEQLSETCGILGAITVDELEARECKVGHNVHMLDDESLLESVRLTRICGTVKQVFKDYIIFFCNELQKFVSCLKSRLVISLENVNSLKKLKEIKFTLICRCFTFMMRRKVIDFVAVLAFCEVEKLLPGIHICNIHPDVLLPPTRDNKLAVGTSHSTAVDIVYEMSNQSAYHHLLGRQTAEFTEAVKINYYFDCSTTIYHVECQGMLVKIDDDDCTKGFVQVVIDGISQNLAITREVLWGDLTKDMPLSTLIYSPLRIILRMSDSFGKKRETLKIVLAWREYKAINTFTTAEIGSCPRSVKLNGICCHTAFILSHFERSRKTSEFQVFTAYRNSKSSNNREEFLLMTFVDNSSQIVSCLEAFQVSIENEIEKNKGPWQVLVSRPKDDKLIALLAWQGRICNLRMMVCSVHGTQPLDVKLEEGNYVANKWWDDTRLSCSRSGSYSSVATESSHPYEMERNINGNNWLQSKSSESISVMSTDIKMFDANQLRVSRSLEASSSILCSKDIELGSSFPSDINSVLSVVDPSVSPMHDFEKNFLWEGTDDLQNKFTHVEAPSEYIVNKDLSKPLLFNKVDTPTLTDDVGEEIFYSSSSSNGSMDPLIDQNPGTFNEMHEQSLSNDLFPTIGNTVLDNGLNQNSQVSHDKVFDCLENFSQSDDEETNHDSAVADVQPRKSNSLSVLVDQSFRGSESGHLKEGETLINANDGSVEKPKNGSKSSNIEAKTKSTSQKCRSENSLPTSDNSSIRLYSAAVKHPVHAPLPKNVMIHFEVMSDPVYATCTVYVSKRKFAILKGAGKVILLMAENMHVRKRSKCVDDLKTILSKQNVGVHHVEVRQPANKKVLAISNVAVVAYLGKKPQSVKDDTDAWKRNCMKTLKLSKADVDCINSSIASLSSNNSCVSDNLKTANNVPVKGKAKTDSETPPKLPKNPSSSPSKKVKKVNGKPAKPFKVNKETGIMEVEVSKGNILRTFFTKQVVYIHKKSIPSNHSLASSMADLKEEKWYCNAHPFLLKKGKAKVITGVEVQLLADLIWYGQKPSKEDIIESEREASAKSALETEPSRLRNVEDRNSPNLRNGRHQESETAEWSQKQDNPASGAIKKRTKTRRKSTSDHSSSSKNEEHCQRGTIIELHQTVGCLLTSDEKSLYFSRDQCYLHGVCLVNVELNHVLSIGLEVSCEVKTSHQSVNKVWVGELRVLDGRDLIMKLRMWCGYHQVPNKATNTLLLDAGWLPTDLEPMLNEADDRDVVNL